MKIVFETIKILLLSIIALLLSADIGLVSLPDSERLVRRISDALGYSEAVPDATALSEVPADVGDGGEWNDSPAVESTESAAQLPDDVVELPPSNEMPLLSPSSAEGQALTELPRADPQEQGDAYVDINIDTVDGRVADSVVAEDSLEALLRGRLASRYEFPEHVKFKHTHLTVLRLFADAGIDVELEREVEYAVLCGEYAAPNPAALYGPFRPFFAEVLVNHADQSIDGELWLDVDGDIKKSISFRSDLLISARREGFDSRFGAYCGQREQNVRVGEYRHYQVGQLASYYRQHFAELAAKAALPGYAERLLECVQTDETVKECYRTLGGEQSRQ